MKGKCVHVGIVALCLTFQTILAQSYTIQASTNLANWIALTNLVSTTGTNQFIDTSAR